MGQVTFAEKGDLPFLFGNGCPPSVGENMVQQMEKVPEPRPHLR